MHTAHLPPQSVVLTLGVRLQEKPAGPHVLANLQVLFTRERFAHMICYLTFAAPKTFSTLIHEMTADLVGRHSCHGGLLSSVSQVGQR